MMRKAKKHFIALCAPIATAALAVTVGIGAHTAQPVSAEVVDNVVMTTYTKGQEFILPSSVTIADGDKSYESTESYIVYPSGKAYSGSKFILNDCGEYKAVFETKVNGKRYVAEKEFTVEEGIYSVSMPDSSFSYGQLNDNFDDKWNYKEGMLVDLAEGDFFKYNKPFNIYEEDTSNMLVFNMMTVGTDMSIGAVTIRLTDCYDPTNYMDIMYLRLYKNELYFRAGISGQATAGLYHAGPFDGYVTIDDTSYMYFVNKSGTMLPTNYDQETVGAGNKPYNNNLRIYLDTTDREHIRVRGATDMYAFDRLITELNNETIYPYHWDGFTTGDVFLSISASNFSGRSTAPLEIARIMDAKGEDLMPVVNKDNTAPTILLDKEGDGATIAKGVPVQVPAASARDISGVVGGVKTAVYYAYGSSFQTAIPLTNGKFTPVTYGDYTVVYQATDVYGNTSQKYYVMMASIEAEVGIQFTAPNFEGLKAGDSVMLSGYTVQGFNGDVSVSMALTDPTGQTRAYENGQRAFLERAGEYTATYTYKDAAYDYVKDIVFNVVDAGAIDFTTDIAIPYYFIKNASYTLEGAEAYRYSANAPALVNTKCYVNFDDKGYVECNPDEVKITAQNTVQIKYVSEDNENVYLESNKVSVVDVGFGGAKLSVGEYFVGDFDYEVKNSNITYTANSSGDKTMEFVNPISFANFYFGFTAGAKNAIGDMTITLTDFYDRSNVLTIQLTKDKKGVGHMTLNGEKSIILTQDYATGNTYVNFANGMITLNSIDEIAFSSPFTFDKCLFSVTLHNVSKGASILINKLGNQAMGKLFTDPASPMIYVESIERVGTLGGSFIVNKPAVTDVLTPIIAKNVTVTVYFNREPLRATNGTVMNKVSDFSKEYELITENFGDYLISFNYTDGNNPDVYRQEVRVIDREAPQLTIHSTHIEMNAGDYLPEISFTVTDNLTATEKIDIWFLVIDCDMVVVATGKEKVAVNDIGTYTVWVWVADETGNGTYGTVTLTVK